MDKYIYYSKGTNHDNSDDVAITEANSLEEAVGIFKIYYTNASKGNVRIIECHGVGCNINMMFVSEY